MRFAAIVAVLLLAPAAALAHNRCGCLSRSSGPPGAQVTIKGGWTAYRVVWNGRGLAGHRSLNRFHRRGFRTIELVKLPRARRGVRFRVPRVPPGIYPVVIYDGSEGGTHYVWELFRLRR